MNANDRSTYMPDLAPCLTSVHEKGYTNEFKVEGEKLICFNNNKSYAAADLKIKNFYRFEGISNPEDMSILYAIETSDGTKGTLIDAYGTYADEMIGELMKKVKDIHKINPHEIVAMAL